MEGLRSVGDPEDSKRTSEPRSELERWLNDQIFKIDFQFWDVWAVKEFFFDCARVLWSVLKI